MIQLRDEVVEDILIDITHCKLLLGILANLGNPGATGLDIVLTDALYGSLVDFFETIVVENQLVGPCPLVFAVVVVDLIETAEYLMDALNRPVLDILEQALLLAGRQQQTREVVPLSQSDFTYRLAQPITLDGTLQDGTHIDAQGDIVVFDTLLQRRGVDDILLEVVRRDVVATSLTQVFQYLLTLDNLTHLLREEAARLSRLGHFLISR